MTGMLYYPNVYASRGNQLKLIKKRPKHNLREFAFTNRVSNMWNSLLNYIVMYTNQFKNNLDKFGRNQEIRYNYFGEQSGIGCRSVALLKDQFLICISCFCWDAGTEAYWPTRIVFDTITPGTFLYYLIFDACDPNCNSTSGCNIHGAGKCDALCTAGYGLTSSFICQSKHFVLVCDGNLTMQNYWSECSICIDLELINTK